MLVLQRKLNEKIVIGGGIVITVVAIDQGRVRLGVTAPRETAVFRSELLGDAARAGGAPQPAAPR